MRISIGFDRSLRGEQLVFYETESIVEETLLAAVAVIGVLYGSSWWHGQASAHRCVRTVVVLVLLSRLRITS